MAACFFGQKQAAFPVYLGRIVTVNELLEIWVSVPPKVAEPVAENVPASNGTKSTVTSMV